MRFKGQSLAIVKPTESPTNDFGGAVKNENTGNNLTCSNAWEPFEKATKQDFKTATNPKQAI